MIAYRQPDGTLHLRGRLRQGEALCLLVTDQPGAVERIDWPRQLVIQRRDGRLEPLEVVDQPDTKQQK